MKRIASSEKETLIQKVLNQPNRKVKEIAEEANVGCSTLHKWVATYRRSDLSNAKKVVGSKRTDAQQYQAVLDCENQTDEYRNRYCRQHGIYPHQLIEWKEQLMKKTPNETLAEQKSENKKLKEENKKLQRELKRKEKALVEVSALLILKKKWIYCSGRTKRTINVCS